MLTGETPPTKSTNIHFMTFACVRTLPTRNDEERSKVPSREHRCFPLKNRHLSAPSGEDERPLWLSRYSAFLAASGVEPDKAAAARDAVTNHLEILGPAQDEAILREAGFSDPTLFYIGFTFRGWVAYA